MRTIYNMNAQFVSTIIGSLKNVLNQFMRTKYNKTAQFVVIVIV